MADIQSGNDVVKNDGLKGASGELKFVTNRQNADSPLEAQDHSYVSLTQLDGSSIKLGAGGSVRIDTPGVMSTNVTGSAFETIGGGSVSTIGRDLDLTIGGRIFIRGGTQTSAEKKAYDELQKIASSIQESAFQAAASVKDGRVPCPLCNAKVVTESASNDTKIYAQRSGYAMVQIPYIGPAVKWLIGLASWIPPFSITKKQAAIHGNTCGSPGCVNNSVAVPQKTIEIYNERVSKEFVSRKEEINKQHIALGQQADAVVNFKNGLVISTGLTKNTSKAYLTKGHNSYPISLQGIKGREMTYSGKGNAPKVLYTQPVQLTDGSLYLNVSERFTVNAGATGISLETNGQTDIVGGGIDIRATDGEAHFGSGNVTSINGKMVIITADDRSGDTGILLQSDHVMVQRALSVGAGLAVKGPISTDGDLSIPFLNCPGMSQTALPVKPSAMMGAVQTVFPASVMVTLASNVKDTVTKIAADLTWIMRPDNLMSYTQALYDQSIQATGIDWNISGWAMVITQVTGTCSYGGTVTAIGQGSNGIMPTFCPVFSYYHNHGKYHEETQTEITLPRGNYHMTQKGVNAARAVAPIVAIPFTMASKMGESSGPHAIPGPCGGGGMFVKGRNDNYGFTDGDPWGGNNWIDRGTPFPGLTGDLFKMTDPEFSWLKYGIGYKEGDLTDCT